MGDVGVAYVHIHTYMHAYMHSLMAFVGIAVVAVITQYGFANINEPLLIGTLHHHHHHDAHHAHHAPHRHLGVLTRWRVVVVGSFGATAVLVYAAQQSPLAQPKNVFFGHGISAIVGVTCYKAMGNEWYYAQASVAVLANV